MKKKLLFITAVFLLPALLACCRVPETPVSPVNHTTPAPEKAEYVRISPQDAETMMSGDVVILDVRTQDEFDAGHIENAILLPDYEIAEKAESVIADKAQTVLIYCRAGRRSEAAAKELIDMGYTGVFDFGGIEDWHGEIVREQ